MLDFFKTPLYLYTMKTALKNIFVRHSWLGYLNFYLLQFAAIRLARTVDVAEDGTETTLNWSIIFVIPFTGWWGNMYEWLPITIEWELKK